MRAAMTAVLQADAALMALLTGGVYDAGVVEEISRPGTPGAFDPNGEIKPCALVRSTSLAAMGPYRGSTREIVVIYFYQLAGYGTIEAAAARAWALLHDEKVGADGCWLIRHVEATPNAWDEALGCALMMSRYEVTRRMA